MKSVSSLTFDGVCPQSVAGVAATAVTVAADSGVAVGSVVETAVTVGAMAAVAAAATKWEDGELDGSLYV